MIRRKEASGKKLNILTNFFSPELMKPICLSRFSDKMHIKVVYPLLRSVWGIILSLSLSLSLSLYEYLYMCVMFV